MALRRQSPHELEGSQAIMRRSPIAIPAGVIGQVRRDGRRQAGWHGSWPRMKSRSRYRIATSDAGDLRRLDPAVSLIRV
jgi:hypothetical protein